MAAVGALSAEELEMVRFMRASKSAAAQDGGGAAAGGAAAELSARAVRMPAGAGPADAAAEAQQRSNPSSPVDEPPGAGGGAPGGDGLSDDALLAFDVDAAVAAAGEATVGETGGKDRAHETTVVARCRLQRRGLQGPAAAAERAVV